MDIREDRGWVPVPVEVPSSSSVSEVTLSRVKGVVLTKCSEEDFYRLCQVRI